jgi:hypothetical protein
MLSHLFNTKDDIASWANGYGNPENGSSITKRIECGTRQIGCDQSIINSLEDLPQAFRQVIKHERRRMERPVAYYKSSSRTLAQLQEFAASIGYSINDCLTPDGQQLLRREIVKIMKINSNQNEMKDDKKNDTKESYVSHTNTTNTAILESIGLLSVGVFELLSEWDSSPSMLPVHCTLRIYNGKTYSINGKTSIHQDKATTEWNKDRVCIHASSTIKKLSFFSSKESKEPIYTTSMGKSGYHWMTSNIRNVQQQQQQIYHQVNTNGIGITYILTTSGSSHANSNDLKVLTPTITNTLDRLNNIILHEKERWRPLNNRIRELSGENVDKQIQFLHNMEIYAKKSIAEQELLPPKNGSLLSQTALRQKWQGQVWT